jgi:hypothetical protein
MGVKLTVIAQTFALAIGIAFASFRSRAGMIVPVVGSVVGGIVNSSFQNDVGKAARFAFQARRLKTETV